MPAWPVPRTQGRPLVLGHRGASREAPENTLAAFRLAMAQGADGFELDVWRCGSGEPVVIHDASAARSTGEDLDVRLTPLSRLRRLDASALGGSGHRGERIPTLREVLAEINGRALLVLEIKAPDIEEQVLTVVRRANALDSCVVHSFAPKIVARVRELEPRMPCSLLTGGEGAKDAKKLFALALSIGAQGVAVHYAAVTPEFVRAAHLRELRCSTWTVNRRLDVRRVARAGVDAITSDYPDRVRRWLPRA